MLTITLKVELKLFVLVILALVCWIHNETEKRKILEVISDQNSMLKNDFSKIELTLAKLSEVLERNNSEIKEAISSVNEELKGLKTDFGAFKQFMEDTTGNTYDKVEEIHTIVTKSGLFESLKQVFRVLCGIASTLSYIFPKFHAVDSLCNLSYYV